ncbi:MAG TPA: type II toxin-antitoxin system VapC family toxin [Isosphaeraceae bacterium]|nr:type II toxin-antitoxin system VapC family toxin [Isosphaeraceae bacterium]
MPLGRSNGSGGAAYVPSVNRRHGVRERVDEARHQGNRIGIRTPVLGELGSGIARGVSRDRNLHRPRLAVSRLVVWPDTNEAAEQFGRVFVELRRIGRPRPQIDNMAAAIAFSLGNCTVVTKHTDLSAVPGLEVENWVPSAT